MIMPSEIITALLGFLAGIIVLMVDRNKRRATVRKEVAETANLLTETALGLMEPLNVRILQLEHQHATQAAEIRRLVERVDCLERQRDDLWRGAAALARQVRDIGYEPVYEPSPLNHYREVQSGTTD